MQHSRDGGACRVGLQPLAVQRPGQNLVQPGAMHIPAKDRDGHCNGSQPCDNTRNQGAPLSALEEEKEQQRRKDFAGSSNSYQRTSQNAKAAQITPARRNDQQENNNIELAEQEIAIQREAQGKG